MEQTSAWQQANYQYLLAEIASLKQQLTDNNHATLTNTAAVSDGAFALDKLVDNFDLSASERQLLLLCLGCALDPELAALYQQVYSYAHPTLGSVLSQGYRAILAPDGPLRYWQLIDVNMYDTLLNSSIMLNEWTWCYLLGYDSMESGLLPYLSAVKSHTTLAHTHHVLIEQALTNLPSNTTLQLLGEFSVGGGAGSVFPAGEVIAKAIADSLGYRLYHLHVQGLEDMSYQEILYYGRLLQREAKARPIMYALDIKSIIPVYNQAVLAFTPVNQRIKKLVLELQETIAQQVILYARKPWESSNTHLIHLDILLTEIAK